MDKIYLAFAGVSDVANRFSPININATTSTGEVSVLHNTIFVNVVNAIVLFISIGAVLSLVYGGILYITSGGDPEKTNAGKRVIMYSVIAIVVAISAYMIYTFVLGKV